MIPLTANNFDKEDIKSLAKWISKNPQLSQGKLTIEFEKRFAEKFQNKYSVFVNSGSSANLAMIYATILHKQLKNKKIVIPAVCWSTTISPAIQLGLEPIICDIDLQSLGIDLNCLETIFKKYKPSIFLAVNILGFASNYREVMKLCFKYNVILLVDGCESLGSTYETIPLNDFGLMTSCSFYFSHQLVTCEGGIITTNDEELADILKMIREHGWDRKLNAKKQKELRKKYGISDFNALYTFYYPSFNIRNTDIGAFLGLRQLDKVDDIIKKRAENFNYYDIYLNNNYWKVKPIIGDTHDVISNLAYPVIHPKRNKIVKALKENEVDCRPLVCGNITNQPFVKDKKYIVYDKNASIIDKWGFYVPNYPSLTLEQIKFICDIINEVIN